MTRRLLLAAAAALALTGPALAQSADDTTLTPPGVLPQAAVAPAPCAAGGCGTGGPLVPRGWVYADYLFAWVQNTNLPPLVTTSPAGTDRALAGVFGAPGTTTLFGGHQNGSMRPGMRFGAGYWFDEPRTIGIEGSFLMLGSQATLFSASSDGSTILARPFRDPTTDTVQAALIAFPGSSSGNVEVRSASGNFYTFAIDLTENIIDRGWFRLNGLVGYRMFRYDESLRIRQNIAPTSAAFVPGTVLFSEDNFGTENVFHGCDLGFRWQFLWQNFRLDILTRAAIGRIHREVGIAGNTVTMVPGAAPVSETGGLYALSSNIGTHTSHDWGALPELGGTLTWQVLPSLGLRVGYSVLALDNVARAGDQVNQIVNPALLPPASAAPTGPIQPTFNLHPHDMWVQSLNLGVVFTY